MQGIQRPKQHNCGGLVTRQRNTMDRQIYGSQEQMGSGPEAISLEIEGSLWDVPDTAYAVYDCVTDQANRKPNFDFLQTEWTQPGFGSSTCFLPNWTAGNAIVETPIKNDGVSIWNPGSVAQHALSSGLGAMTNHHNAVGLGSSGVNVGEHNGCSQAIFPRVNSTETHSALEGRRASYPSFGSYSSLSMASARETTQFSVTGSVSGMMENSGNFHDHINGARRSSCKRKRSMTGIPGSLPFRPSHSNEIWDSNFARFIEGCGPNRSDAGNSACAAPEVFHSATSAPRVYNRGDLHYDTGIALNSGRGNPALSGPNGRSNRYVCGKPSHMQQEPYHLQFHPFSMQNNRKRMPTMPSETWRSRGMLVSEQVLESAANINTTILPDQICSYPLTSPWCANNNHTMLPGPVREFAPCIFEGHQTRSSNGVSNWPGITNIDSQVANQTTFDFPGRAALAFNTRQSHSHVPHVGANAFTYPGTVALESPAQLSTMLLSRHNTFPSQGHLLSPATSAAPENLMIGANPVSVDGYPSPAFVHGPCNSAMPSSLLDGPGGGGLASSMQTLLWTPFRRLQILPVGRGNRHRFESEELFDQSLDYNRVDIHDQYGDMRLDVDNMSYEELLALEESIGNVNTGLSDDTMAKCLKTSKYSSLDVTEAVVTHESEIKCSICQEEYVEEDELGRLNCGHSYHSICIKQWLVQKNQCPICKSAACASS